MVKVDPLRAHEAPLATELLRHSFAPELIEHGTVRCSGYPTYLADQLTTSLPRALDAWAVRDEHELLGVLVANRGQSSSHLAYVAVAPPVRGWGIAQALTDTWIATSMARGCARLTLDVAAGNWPAHGLYSRLGFTHVESRRTTVTPLARLTQPADELWWSDDLTGFLGSFQRYGFGRLRLSNASEQSVTVGVLDSGFVRHPLTSELLSAAPVLARLVPGGHILSSETAGGQADSDTILRLEKRLSRDSWLV